MNFIFRFLLFIQGYYKKVVDCCRFDSNLSPNLIIRFKSSVILFCFSMIAIISNTFFNILFVVSGIVMLFEWDRMFYKNLKFNISKFFIINILIYFLSLASVFLLDSYAVATVILMFGFIVSMFVFIYLNHDRFILEAVPSIYISGAVISSLYLHSRFDVVILIFLFIVTISTDICAYFVGSYFKGLKLAPFISPNKTVSGSVGGVIGAFVFSCFYMIVLFLLGFTNSITDLHLYGLLAIILSVLSQCGDLFESYCKRLCSVKDSGNLIAGHGGMLDRFDSFIAIVSVCAVIFALI